MIPRIVEHYGRHAEELASAAEKAGHRETALELYSKAMHPYHIGQHAIYEDDKAAKRLGISQPRVSEITRGKVELLSLDYLVGLCAKAGIPVGVRLAA